MKNDNKLAMLFALTNFARVDQQMLRAAMKDEKSGDGSINAA